MSLRSVRVESGLMLLPILLALLLGETFSFSVDYFAFGSNMNPALLERRTMSTPGSLKFDRAVLRDYKLVFNTGSKSFGMAASVEPSKGDSVHGLSYRINLVQLNLLLISEGYPVGYKLETVTVLPYNGRPTSNVLTLRSGRGLLSGKPSDRYLKLLQNGAADHDLNADYQQFLRSIESI